MSPNSFERLQQQCPEYFEENENGPQRDEQGKIMGLTPYQNYRGWKIKITSRQDLLKIIRSDLPIAAKRYNISIEFLYSPD